MTEEAAASELLKRWGANDDTPPPKDGATEDEPDPQADEATADEGEDEDDPSEESDDIEVDVAGEKFKLPKVLAEQAQRIEAKVKEIEAGATRKFQEAAEVRKVAESQIEHAKQLTQLSAQEVELHADLRMVDRRLQQIMSFDTNALGDSDPVALTKLTAEFNQLQMARQQIAGRLGEVKAQSQTAKSENQQAHFSRLNEYAGKHIKGWSEDYSRTLHEFSVKELGADPDALRNVMSEPVLKALDLAYRGWKVQTATPLRKQVTATKTLKPGAVGQSSNRAQQSVETANKRLGQTGKVDDAAAALLARMNAKRR
jgi:hypothetical protein